MRKKCLKTSPPGHHNNNCYKQHPLVNANIFSGQNVKEKQDSGKACRYIFPDYLCYNVVLTGTFRFFDTPPLQCRLDLVTHKK